MRCIHPTGADGDVPAENRGHDLGGGGTGLRGVGDAGGHAGSRPSPLPTKLGLAFQIRDDMLDVVGDEAVFGKPIGSDREEGKVTFVDVLGLEGCRTAVEECTRRAEEAILPWPDHDFLLTLAHSLEERKK